MKLSQSVPFVLVLWFSLSFSFLCLVGRCFSSLFTLLLHTCCCVMQCNVNSQRCQGQTECAARVSVSLLRLWCSGYILAQRSFIFAIFSTCFMGLISGRKKSEKDPWNFTFTSHTFKFAFLKKEVKTWLWFPVSRLTMSEQDFYYRWCRQMGNSAQSGQSDTRIIVLCVRDGGIMSLRQWRLRR